MTMPKTATLVRSIGSMSAEMTQAELDAVLLALREDLPGSPIEYIMRAMSVDQRCGCGALHLSLDAADLDTVTRGSLHRLLATPFGDIVREYIRRQSDISTVRFGWSGVQMYAPKFVRVVDIYEARQTYASELTIHELGNIVAAIREDLPGMMAMCDTSLAGLSVTAVGPGEDDFERLEWKALIEQVMFAFSTPLRKYLDEYARRMYDGAYVGAVNCCIVMSGRASETAWNRQWFGEQVDQQLTPDC